MKPHYPRNGEVFKYIQVLHTPLEEEEKKKRKKVGKKRRWK